MLSLREVIQKDPSDQSATATLLAKLNDELKPRGVRISVDGKKSKSSKKDLADYVVEAFNGCTVEEQNERINLMLSVEKRFNEVGVHRYSVFHLISDDLSVSRLRVILDQHHETLSTFDPAYKENMINDMICFDHDKHSWPTLKSNHIQFKLHDIAKCLVEQGIDMMRFKTSPFKLYFKVENLDKIRDIYNEFRGFNGSDVFGIVSVLSEYCLARNLYHVTPYYEAMKFVTLDGDYQTLQRFVESLKRADIDRFSNEVVSILNYIIEILSKREGNAKLFEDLLRLLGRNIQSSASINSTVNDSPLLKSLDYACKRGDRDKMAVLLELGKVGRVGYEKTFEWLGDCRYEKKECYEYLLNSNPCSMDEKELFLFLLNRLPKTYYKTLLELKKPKIEWIHEYLTGITNLDSKIFSWRFLSICEVSFNQYGLEFARPQINDRLTRLMVVYEKDCTWGKKDFEKIAKYSAITKSYYVTNLQDPSIVSVFEGYLGSGLDFISRNLLHRKIEKVLSQLLNCDDGLMRTPEQLCRFKVARCLNNIFCNPTDALKEFQEVIKLEAEAGSNLTNGSIIKRFFETMMVRMRLEVNGQRKLIVSLQIWNALKEGYLNAVGSSAKNNQGKLKDESTELLVKLLKDFTHPAQVASAASSSSASATSKDHSGLHDPIRPPKAPFPVEQKESDSKQFLDSKTSVVSTDSTRVSSAIVTTTSSSHTASTSDNTLQVSGVHATLFSHEDLVLPSAPTKDPVAARIQTTDDDDGVDEMTSAHDVELVELRQAVRH